MMNEVLKNGFLCRGMNEQDIEACAAIEAQAPDSWSAKALREELQQENARLFVAEQDGTVAALAVFQFVCGEASLCAVSTEKNMRRRGAAKALLSAAFDFLLAEGAETVFLEVRSENQPALALYRSLGFESVGLRRNFYQNPHDDAVLMQKTFSSNS